MSNSAISNLRARVRRRAYSAAIFLLFGLAFFLRLPALAAEERGLKVAPAEQRLALVVGNGNYKNQRLANPVNDAKDIAQTLRGLGFVVIERLDASMQVMEEAIAAFGKTLQKGGVSLFYYAGHGVQVAGRNYLIPVDARIETESDVKYKAVDAGLVLGKMEDAEGGVNIVILDACRNNPFARAFKRGTATRGLAQMDAPSGTLIVYATSPGAEASDGDERNGVFTKYLLRELKTPNQTIGQALQRVRAQVIHETSAKQVPWESSSLTGDFYPAGRSETANVEATSQLEAERQRLDVMHAQLETERRSVEEERSRIGASKEPIAIGQMDIGQKAWVDPLAMYADKNKKVWLRRDYKAAPWPLGIMTMLVERTEAGFSVDLERVKHKWESVREAEPNDPPVAELRYKKTTQTVADMQVGQKAWVKPEAMYADAERKLWLKSDAIIAPEAAPALIQIVREASGFVVDVTTTKKRKFATNVARKENDLTVEKLVY